MTDEERKTGAAARIDIAREGDFALGSAQVSPSTREILIAGERQTLQPRVMQVLIALARRKGEVVSRDELVMSCWEGLSVSEDSINRCIGQLRRLSEEGDGGIFAIETIARVGYRLTAGAPAAASPVSQTTAKPRIAILPFENLSPDPANAFFTDGLHEEICRRSPTAHTASKSYRARP